MADQSPAEDNKSPYLVIFINSMHPLINLILIIPAGLLLVTLYLLRVKSILEDLIYQYRSEGIILQTSLTLIALPLKDNSWKKTLGMVLMTKQRFIAYDWRKRIIFNCVFDIHEKHGVILKKVNNKQIILQYPAGNKFEKLRVNVRSPDAWVLEFKNINPIDTLNRK